MTRGAVPVEVSDVVIVGGGAAGLATALAIDGRRVRLLAKGAPGADGASAMAQGGIAAALGAGDSAARHAADTIEAAGELAVEGAVDALTLGARDWIETLERLGTGFDRGPDGELALGREAAHRLARIVHAEGDRTGHHLSRALGRAVLARTDVIVERGVVARDLIVAGGRVIGVEAHDPSRGAIRFLAPAVVLATGGIGRLYRDTTNPASSTGDGLAMAARAGAWLADLEFVQFHPTALAAESDPRPLLTEALRGAGATLVDDRGERFMVALDPRAELAPRDVVARAIARRLRDGQVWLDATGVAPRRFAERFPTVWAICRRHGLDPRRQRLPVRPAEHYHMGGVLTDLDGRTTLPGLWAAGEVACTGVHGANRLASNSLLECLVFGGRVARDLARQPRRPVTAVPEPVEVADPTSCDPAVEAAMRAVMSRHLGILRDGDGLESARRELSELEAPASGDPRLRSMWTAAALITAAATRRRESRGSHHRTDRPTVAADRHRWAVRIGVDGPLTPCFQRLEGAGRAVGAAGS